MIGCDICGRKKTISCRFYSIHATDFFSSVGNTTSEIYSANNIEVLCRHCNRKLEDCEKLDVYLKDIDNYKKKKMKEYFNSIFKNLPEK
jgi:hypothetical protein